MTSPPTPGTPAARGGSPGGIGYLLGHNGDLDKADEEEDERGTCHVGTESVIHLLGVLRGQGQGEWVEAPGPVCSSPPPPQTHSGQPTPKTWKTQSRTSTSLSSQETSPLTIWWCLWGGPLNYVKPETLQVGSP